MIGKPRISVVIPTFNRRRTVHSAIQSVLNQTLSVFEVIVVDDGSTDGTVDSVRMLNNSRLHVVAMPIRSGANIARNKGVSVATGSHIAFLDSDDLFDPSKLELQLKSMQTSNARFSTCAFRTTTGKTYKTRPANSLRLLRQNCLGGTSGLIAERSLLLLEPFAVGLPAVQDWELFLRLDSIATGVHCTDPLYTYTVGQADQITAHNRRRALGHISLYKTHIKNRKGVSFLTHCTHKLLHRTLIGRARNFKRPTLLHRIALKLLSLL